MKTMGLDTVHSAAVISVGDSCRDAAGGTSGNKGKVLLYGYEWNAAANTNCRQTNVWNRPVLLGGGMANPRPPPSSPLSRNRRLAFLQIMCPDGRFIQPCFVSDIIFARPGGLCWQLCVDREQHGHHGAVRGRHVL